MSCPFDLVSPVVAAETVVNAFYAILAAAVGVFLYVWWAFRNMPSPFRYGAAAIVALLHDTAVVVGVFAGLGVLLDVEVNTMFLIALLTVIGYSVNDTIVVFDRLRENVVNYPNRSLKVQRQHQRIPELEQVAQHQPDADVHPPGAAAVRRPDHTELPLGAPDRRGGRHLQLRSHSHPRADGMGRGRPPSHLPKAPPRLATGGYCAVVPPSMTRSAPVT